MLEHLFDFLKRKRTKFRGEPRKEERSRKISASLPFVEDPARATAFSYHRGEIGGCAVKLTDYLATEFASFSEMPFGEIDAAALADFMMARTEGMVPPLREPRRLSPARIKALKGLAGQPKSVRFVDLMRAEQFPIMFQDLEPERTKRTYLGLAASPRFREMRLAAAQDFFDDQRQNQFFATSFIQGKDFAFIGFRGTDVSITGWRENCNMVYSETVPAQVQAREYLEAVAPLLPDRLYLGGHSKGGNLALYAALFAPPEIQERIQMVYTFDSPGFRDQSVPEAAWKTLEGKIDRKVPTDSFVGLLMHTEAPIRVVSSSASGIPQHSLHTWEIEEGRFSPAETLSENSLFLNSVMNVWLERYNPPQAKAVVDALFAAIEASGATDATEVLFSGPKAIGLVREAARHLDAPTREVLMGALGSLAATVAAGTPTTLAARFGGKSAK